MKYQIIGGDSYWEILTQINSIGKTFFLFNVFFSTSPIGKYDVVSIIGALYIFKVKLMIPDNDKTQNQTGWK